MTCRHVLRFIDAGPFADVSPADLDRAWSHAANCPTCGPAVDTSRALTVDLRSLAQPTAPTTIEATVMARLAAVEGRDSETVSASTAPAGTPD